MPDQANGSPEKSADGKIIGSRLIGQQWTGPQSFHGRPSKTVNLSDRTKASPYNAANMTAFNLGPASKALQVQRVAKTRGVPQEQIAALVEQHITPRSLGIFGKSCVNVLELNLARQTGFPKR